MNDLTRKLLVDAFLALHERAGRAGTASNSHASGEKPALRVEGGMGPYARVTYQDGRTAAHVTLDVNFLASALATFLGELADHFPALTEDWVRAQAELQAAPLRRWRVTITHGGNVVDNPLVLAPSPEAAWNETLARLSLPERVRVGPAQDRSTHSAAHASRIAPLLTVEGDLPFSPIPALFEADELTDD